ncbi:hypothetical protein Q31b_41760 [Novipirellula aureliae]|uniref:Uncharacterized protein n=2 Tax=Novipirellula aureliae TaxID=2527966 RepID=A0A5C6DSD1_9BACT|nr:hypothetical protein Q31b_41760 [Novipirellula aureliae]
MAETTETSDYTGARDRLDDLAERQDRSRPSTHEWERSRRRRKSGWMSPIEIDEKNDPVGPCVDAFGRRASSKGFLAVSMGRYLELLDWTGRQLHRAKIGKISDHLAPILSRIGLDTHGWCEIVKKFGRVFKRAAGTPESLAREAICCGQGWMCAPENPLSRMIHGLGNCFANVYAFKRYVHCLKNSLRISRFGVSGLSI